MKKLLALLLAVTAIAACTPEPQPEENEFKQEVVDHNDVDYNWE